MFRSFGLPSALAQTVLPPVAEGSTAPSGFDDHEALAASAYSTVVERGGMRAPSTGGIDPTSVPFLTISIDMLLILGIDPITLKVIDQIDGVRTVEELRVGGAVDESDMLGVLRELVEAKLIVMVAPYGCCA